MGAGGQDVIAFEQYCERNGIDTSVYSRELKDAAQRCGLKVDFEEAERLADEAALESLAGGDQEDAG